MNAARRFAPDFVFPLTRKEIARISQSVTSYQSAGRLRFSKSVYAFTEQGVAMLSSERAAASPGIVIERGWEMLALALGEKAVNGNG